VLVALPLEELVRARAAASLALVAVTAVMLAGCSLWMEPETQVPYDPSDGINVNVGELQLRNVLVVTEDGVDGNLVMTIVNQGDDDLEVALQYETDGTKHDLTIDVPGDASTEFGTGDAGQLLLEDIGTLPGGLLDLYVQYGEVPGKLLQVPVVSGLFPPYEDLLPTPTPTPKPTNTATPSPSETAEP
jgi:hypothetical protein